MKKSFDYIVIGGGSGGLASARRAAQYGKKTLLIESGRLGGTCVNQGCVPKKVMYNAASMADSFRELAPDYGFTSSPQADMLNYHLNYEKLKRNRDEYIKRLNNIYYSNLEKDGVQYLPGRASFVGNHEIIVDGNQADVYAAEHILIATGGRPIAVSKLFQGGQFCIDSDMFFELRHLPRKVLVVGAGYIAVELAGVFHSLGSDVTLMIRHGHVLRSFDEMLSQQVTSDMERIGIKIIKDSSITKVESKLDLEYSDEWDLRRKLTDESINNLNFTVHAANSKDHDTDRHTYTGFNCVLTAIGREPETKDLMLNRTDVKRNEHGLIKVDQLQNTDAQGIYALGDVCGPVYLTPVAIAAGRRLSDRLFSGNPKHKESHLDYSNVPSVVFSHPAPIGTIGLTEAEARSKYDRPEDKLHVYKSSFTNMYYMLVPPDSPKRVKTIYKIICVGDEERVVGVHLYGMGSDEILQGFGVAMKMGATKADFDSCVAIHPTAAEELVTMR